MQIYYFEPDAMIQEATAREMKGNDLKPIMIDEEFFTRDLSMLAREGNATRGIVLSETPDTMKYVKTLRAAGCNNPILIITNHRNSIEAAEMINQGADDVIVRPFKSVQIIACINRTNRRSHGHDDASVQVGEIVAYFDGRDPEVSGHRLKLSQREHAIFSHLALNIGRVISKDNLYDAVYGMDDNQPFDKVIDVYICKIRKKIESRTGKKYIETVYGRGYKLAAPEEEEASKSDEGYGSSALQAVEEVLSTGS
ncbi:response regulator transcription factor [Sulfitobacter sp. R18_1]|uniref:response regulator transcription factor n=1 Tax=Sulfitobacter sp. R18_1 TaxID=2821104 RepID=UPI001ADD25EB|nr:response regulator transcription factor [Sulfitobacter sp. R18_1]MBO9428636.1 response regulator transcription factor [Sulfitobacter sp. R18_1]